MAAVQSIQRAFSILRALSRSPMGVTQLSESVGLPKSTVARLLAALEEEGAVARIEVGGQEFASPFKNNTLQKPTRNVNFYFFAIN